MKKESNSQPRSNHYGVFSLIQLSNKKNNINWEKPKKNVRLSKQIPGLFSLNVMISNVCIWRLEKETPIPGLKQTKPIYPVVFEEEYPQILVIKCSRLFQTKSTSWIARNLHKFDFSKLEVFAQARRKGIYVALDYDMSDSDPLEHAKVLTAMHDYAKFSRVYSRGRESVGLFLKSLDNNLKEVIRLDSNSNLIKKYKVASYLMYEEGMSFSEIKKKCLELKEYNAKSNASGQYPDVFISKEIVNNKPKLCRFIKSFTNLIVY